MSANADLTKVETYIQQGNIIDNQFFICGHNVKKKKVNVLLFGGPCDPVGSYNDHNKPILLSGYPLTHINDAA